MGTFKWQRHISISKHFSKAEKAMLRSVFDQIAAYHDDDGKELIRYAARQSHGKLKIIPGSINCFDDDGHGTLTINFASAGRIQYTENDKKRSVSLNGVIVHELTHAADNFPSTSQFETISKLCFPAMLRQSQIPDENVKAATEEFLRLAANTSMRHAMSLLITDGLGRIIALEKIKTNGYTELASVLSSTTPDQSIEMLKKVGQIDKDGNPIWETRAVMLTDYLMLKNHGALEPQRGTYNNGQLNGEPKIPYVLNVDTIAHPAGDKPIYRNKDNSFGSIKSDNLNLSDIDLFAIAFF